MPNAETFSVKPIGDFVLKYLLEAHGCSIDMFARNRRWCTFTNDINPATEAGHHMDAEEFLLKLQEEGVGDIVLALFDPPYSPRQVSEHYRAAGREVTSQDTQNGHLYKRVRDALDPLMAPGATVLSFGWQSAGMGIKRGYELIETMLVAHGGGHNDTICIAERKASAVTSQERQS
jgi:hypothetical protein